MRIAPHTFILASVLAFGACSPTADAPTPKSEKAMSESNKDGAADTTSENARLDAWFETQYEQSIRAYPQTLTSRGIDERQDEWNDPSRAFALEQLDKRLEALEDMKSRFDYDKLDANRQLSYRLFEKNVQDDLEGRKWWDHEYTYTQMRGAHASLPTFLMNNHKIKDAEDAENYVRRLETIDQPLDEYTRQAKAKFDKGIAPPQFVYDFVIESSQNIISGAPVDADSENLNLLLADLKKKVENEEIDIDAETKEALYERAIVAISDTLTPAYQRIIAEMERTRKCVRL